MSPRHSAILGLVLCLGQMIHSQEGAPPKPSLRAEPGPVVRRGQPVTFVCQGPAEARLYRLEKDGIRISSYQRSRPKNGSRGSEARFLIPAVSDDTVGSYRCLYYQGSRKSELSEPLDLQVTEEDTFAPPPGAPPKPSLRAEPGPVVRRGQPVTFVCRGPAEARLYRLEKDGIRISSYQKSRPQNGSRGSEARFLIRAVSDDTVGSYRCLYYQGSRKSEHSEPLDLQVTEEDTFALSPEAWPKPSLRAEPGPVVHRGQPVTFVCRGPAGARVFRLDKEGRRVSLDQIGVPQDGSQETEARFLIPAVSEDTVGSFRCLYNQGSYSWSERSEPLDLQVTEEDVSPPPPGPVSRSYRVQNSIRLGLSGLVLLILVAILVEAGLSHFRAPQGPQE